MSGTEDQGTPKILQGPQCLLCPCPIHHGWGSPLWDEAFILGQARSTHLLRWKEALFIHARQTINQPSLQLNSSIITATGFHTTIQTTVNLHSSTTFQQASNHASNNLHFIPDSN